MDWVCLLQCVFGHCLIAAPFSPRAACILASDQAPPRASFSPQLMHAVCPSRSADAERASYSGPAWPGTTNCIPAPHSTPWSLAKVTQMWFPTIFQGLFYGMVFSFGHQLVIAALLLSGLCFQTNLWGPRDGNISSKVQCFHAAPVQGSVLTQMISSTQTPVGFEF